MIEKGMMLKIAKDFVQGMKGFCFFVISCYAKKILLIVFLPVMLLLC